jgi:hypothetical protein
MQVFMYLFHPTGTSTSSAYLACGWHSNCDGDTWDNPKFGTDWDNAGGYGNAIWVRLRGITSSSATVDVGEMRAYTSEYAGCPNAVLADIERADGRIVGKVVNLHSRTSANGQNVVYMQLYAKSAGYRNLGVVGGFVSSDACSSYPHTMQWYASGAFDNLVSQNSPPNIPNEDPACPVGGSFPNCMRAYDPWTTVEYIFGFEN